MERKIQSQKYSLKNTPRNAHYKIIKLLLHFLSQKLFGNNFWENFLVCARVRGPSWITLTNFSSKIKKSQQAIDTSYIYSIYDVAFNILLHYLWIFIYIYI